MNILIVTQYFHPENFRINDLAVDFQNRGHKLTVLTSVPNYPIGRFYEGYGIFKRNREEYKGIQVYRAPCVSRGAGTYFRLSVNYLSYVVGAVFTSLFMIKNKYDIIFVHEPSPITVGIPAIFIKKIKRIPICFWVLDLWPDSVISASKIKSKFIPNLLMPLVKYIYRNCDKILVSSKGFIGSIQDKGIDRTKIEFFPQWAEPMFKPLEKEKKFFSDAIPEDSFKIMFAGNIGECQDFPSILNAAKLLKENKNIHWIILGSGRMGDWVKNKIDEYGLNKCFHMLGRHPLSAITKYYANADAMLVTLKDEHIFSMTIPGKLQAYLACGKPILGMVNGETAKLIKDHNLGFVSNAGEHNALVDNILRMERLGQKERDSFSINSINCYKNYFEREMLFKKAEKLFSTLINK